LYQIPDVVQFCFTCFVGDTKVSGGSIPCLEDALSWCFLDGMIFNILAWYFFSGQMLSSFSVQFLAEHYDQVECILIQYLGDYIKEY
jgi:hypothetical protein